MKERHHIFIANKVNGKIQSAVFFGDKNSCKCEEFIDNFSEHFFGNSEIYWAIYDYETPYSKCMENFEQYVSYRMKMSGKREIL